MKNLFYNISQVLGISIIHSLWQGLLIYLLLKLLLIAYPSLSSGKKHNLLYIGLAILTAWFACTFFIEAKDYNWAAKPFTPVVPGSFTPVSANYLQLPPQHTAPNFFTEYQSKVYHIIKIYLPYISILYIIGLSVNLGRLAFAWEKIRFIKQGMTAADLLQKQVSGFSRQMVIAKNVRLRFSKLVDIPCTVGYLKPIILLPVTLTTQLSAQEIEAILLHELSHIKNNDYLLNLIQQVMAVLLFLNPFAQLISRMISLERENRCDDMVVQITGAPLVYAHALVKLEDARRTDPQLILAATGKKQHLFSRVERIMKQKKPAVNIKHLLLALIIFIGSIGSIAWLNPEIKNGKIVSKHGSQAIHQLTAIVKKAIAPAKAEAPVTQNNEDIIRNSRLIDTSKKTPVSLITDTLKNAATRKAQIINEFQQLWKEIQIDIEEERKLSENIQAADAYKILDSLRIARHVVTPEVKKESKEKRVIMDAYFASPGYKAKKAVYDRQVQKAHDLLLKNSEWIQSEKDYERGTDSVRKKLAEDGVKLNMDKQAQDKELWAWRSNFLQGQDALRLMILNSPEIKPVYDSIDTINRWLNSGPEFEKVRQETKASPAMMAETPGLESYRVAYKAALNRLQNTPTYKKHQADLKKYNELVEKTKGK